MTEHRELELKDGRRAVIRPVTVADAEAHVELDRALAEDGRGMVLTPQQTRTVDQERARIDALVHARGAGPASLGVVVECQGALVGAGEVHQLDMALCRHVAVLALGVHPTAQRIGLGRAIVRYLVDHASANGIERLELYVRADNDRARALYRELGFVHEATRARFVKLPTGEYVDDHVMVRFLVAR